jgi:enolase
LKTNAKLLKLSLKRSKKPVINLVIRLPSLWTGFQRFYEDGLYNLRTEGKKISSAEMVAMYAEWVRNTPRRSGRWSGEDDWTDGNYYKTIGDKIELVGVICS